MPTRFDLRCPGCAHREEVTGPIGVVPQRTCPTCLNPLVRSFGGQSMPMVNYGFRESHYATEEDANIAKWQFTNA